MIAAESLLHVLLVSDSALPTGAFTTSSGWEAAHHDRTLQSASDASEWLAGMLADLLAPIELPVMARAFRARTSAQGSDASRLLDRLTPIPGWSAASVLSGSRLLELCGERPRRWHRAVALGWMARRRDVPLSWAMTAYAHAALWAQAQVAVRLGLLAPDRAAGEVRELAPDISRAVAAAADGRIQPSASAMWEIAGMRQPHLAVRLFST